MSKLEELIQELCPDGVEYRYLDECCTILDNKRKPVTKSARETGEYPYYGANGIQDYVSDFIFDGTYVLVGEDGSVVTENGTPVVTWASGKIWVNNHAHIIQGNGTVNLRYLYHYLQTINVKPLIHGNIPKLTGKDFRALKIAVPPLEVQQEIVRILDSFTELTAELTAEFTARKQQYEYYYCEIFRFKNINIETQRLENCCALEKGNTPIQKATPGEYPLVVTTSERKNSNSYQFDKPTVCIPLISSRGHGVASLNRIYYQEGKFALGNILCGVTPFNENYLSAKFLYYYLNYKKDVLLVPLMRGGANVAMTVDSLKRVKIPVPPLRIQQQIIYDLDCFDAYCNDLSSGLPAEIEARQKQYEYYRDKLLTFKGKMA